MTIKPKVALSQDFLEHLAKIPASVQGKILKWAIRFQSDPMSSGINYEKINGARDPHLRSVRIDQDWRGIVFRPDQGDVFILLYVDHHDEAYHWAGSRKMTINPVTGAMQIIVLETVVETVSEEPVTTEAFGQETHSNGMPGLFSVLTDRELMSLGTPEECLPQIRAIHTEKDLDDLQSTLPVEAYEGLFLVAAGDTVSQVLMARETRVDLVIDVNDYAKSLDTAESQARFVVVADDETMTAILNAPLAQWRVFLHPTQRKLAMGDRSGPVRILGGAGTGKTVLAMHRAKWLAENRSMDDKKILFTTFTRNLAFDIEANLKSLVPSYVMQKIEVKNLDAWVNTFLRSNKYEHSIVYNRHQGAAAEIWQKALAVRDTTLDFDEKFFEEELEYVVLAQGITTRDEYRMAKRKGRGTILNRAKRDAIWPVFEEYRAQLAIRKLKEVDDAYRDAASLMKGQPPRYNSIIIDETQDFGTQALKLLRAMVAQGTNDLFFVGDGHQRIYSRNRASMSACQIDIRGRSRKLYLNYRTTEEIRRKAIAILEGCEVDDLDDGTDESRRYKSITHGVPPEVRSYPYLEEALDWIVERSKAVTTNKESLLTLCIIAPTNKIAETIENSLKKQTVSCKLIGPDDHDQPDSKAVRIATMHRAKGLEFDEVILVLPKDWNSGWLGEDDAKRLQYVAITRAKRQVTLVDC
ncbi:MAG: DEAD/DEAH box helicase [SAR324 cluster bacterium]|nr:DEAD/DEAH box helicase [SAR324 cluster bacterium]